MCMILSVLFFALMDVLIKITNEYDVGQVMFSRALFGLIPIFFLIPKKKLKYFYKTKRVKLHCLRAGVGTIGMWAIFVGLRNLGTCRSNFYCIFRTNLGGYIFNSIFE